MDDEVLAAPAALVSVVHARVHERLLDAVTIDRDRRLVRVLLDDREQVTEQPPLGRGQFGALDLGVVPIVGYLVNRKAASDQCRRAAWRPQPLLGGSFPSLRYRRPSSCRRAYAR
jgi:hypothetical protein